MKHYGAYYVPTRVPGQQFSKCGLRTCGVSETLLADSQSQNYFHTNAKTLFSFFPVLTFALMLQKQKQVKLLVSV